MIALRRAALLPLLLSLGALGCGDLKEFRGEYRGLIVEGNFVRSCFAAQTEATLRFDPDDAVSRGEGGVSLNTLTTSDLTFQSTPLEPIASLPHDPLSQLDFPGPQRLRNYLLLARPTSGPLAGRDALVVVSLLASESVEVRIIARSADGAPPCPAEGDAGVATTPGEWFGLFRMKR